MTLIMATQDAPGSAPWPRLTREAAARLARPYPFLVRRALSMASQLEAGSLAITMPENRRFVAQGRTDGPHADIRVRRLSFARKLALAGEIGIAASYVDGDWETSDLTAFLELFCRNRETFAPHARGVSLLHALHRAQSWLRRNTRANARRNIHAHYDLGNAFYAAWLDETMTYSAALFPDPPTTLEEAQRRKFRALAESLELAPGHRLLEIGCGWGGFAIFAAKAYGCRVVGLTISREQRDFAQRNVFEAGLADRVDIRLQDYRDEAEVYDRVASIEMIEAVGESYWPLWFRLMRERLADGGRAAVQAITVDETIFPSYRRKVDFIRRCIFPGGMLPTHTHLRETASHAGLTVTTDLAFGADYARTIALWRARFRGRWRDIRAQGFDERFRRLWEFYFAYCEAGFRAGVIDVRQIGYRLS